jgi:SAM-dependent methyltransferase
VTAQESIAFDRMAEDYDRTRGGMERGRSIAPLLHEVLPPGPLLEVGVGTGLVAGGLTELGRRVVGVDLSVPMLRKAASRVPGRIAVGDATRLPAGDAVVGGAYLVHVLHLVGDQAATLAELHRVVRSGGLVAATVMRDEDDPPDDDVWPLVMELYNEFPANRRRPDRESVVVALAERTGFTLADRRQLRRVGYRSTPREVADGLEAKLWSWTWRIPDEQWREAAAPVLARMRALPDQDGRRASEEVTQVLVLRRD